MAVLLSRRPTLAAELRTNHWWAWASLAATLVAGIALLADPFAADPKPAALPDELADEPDLYMQDAIITQYRPSGQMDYQLASPQIRHFEGNHLTRLTAPTLTLHNEAQPPWTIESDYGYVRRRERPNGSSEDVVYLRLNVTLEQRYDDGRRLQMQAPYLYVYPDRQYAETEQAVMIDTDVGRITGMGLRGDLQRGVVEVSSTAQQRVHTIILPGQFK